MDKEIASDVIMVPSTELKAGRHSVLVLPVNRDEPFWCEIAIVEWSKSMDKIQVMFDNHCFSSYGVTETVQVKVNETKRGIGLRSRQEAWDQYYVQAFNKMKEAEKEFMKCQLEVDDLVNNKMRS